MATRPLTSTPSVEFLTATVTTAGSALSSMSGMLSSPADGCAPSANKPRTLNRQRTDAIGVIIALCQLALTGSLALSLLTSSIGCSELNVGPRLICKKNKVESVNRENSTGCKWQAVTGCFSFRSIG